MDMYERRAAIQRILAEADERVSIAYLSSFVGASRRTIIYDLDALTADYPIETYRGNGGGVRLIKASFKNHLAESEQATLLEAIAAISDNNLATRIGNIVLMHGSYRNKQRVEDALKGKVG